MPRQLVLHSRRGESPATAAATTTILSGGVAFGLIAIALVHFVDMFSKFKETPYLGVAYLALIGGCLAASERLVRRPSRRLLLVAGALAAAAFLAYVVSRTVGLPAARDDIGNWTEPLGLAALFLEGLVVAMCAYAAVLLD
jgi:hypothetical protein